MRRQQLLSHRGREPSGRTPKATGSKRKAEAVQAYLEWMPVRDPAPGKAREAIWRKVDIGDLATLFLLESRLVGRGDDLTIDEMFLAPDAEATGAGRRDQGEGQRSAADDARLRAGSVAGGRAEDVDRRGQEMAGAAATRSPWPR